MVSEARFREQSVGMNIGIGGMICHLNRRTGTAPVRDAAIIATVFPAASRWKVVGLSKGHPGIDHCSDAKYCPCIKQEIKNEVRLVVLQSSKDKHEKIQTIVGGNQGRANGKSRRRASIVNSASASTNVKVHALHHLRVQQERAQKGHETHTRAWAGKEIVPPPGTLNVLSLPDSRIWNLEGFSFFHTALWGCHQKGNSIDYSLKGRSFDESGGGNDSNGGGCGYRRYWRSQNHGFFWVYLFGL